MRQEHVDMFHKIVCSCGTEDTLLTMQQKHVCSVTNNKRVIETNNALVQPDMFAAKQHYLAVNHDLPVQQTMFIRMQH